LILDTNAFSALAEGEPTLAAVLSKASGVSIPVIVLGEYRFGISQSRRRTEYEGWLTKYLPSFQVLDVDERTTVPYGDIRADLKRAGKPIPSNDLWIAALCRQHFLPLLSRDRHFDAVPGITRIGW
jgi:tRNA(fMet)-specific endonuclease VapC